jgi:hypothetical protein
MADKEKSAIAEGLRHLALPVDALRHDPSNARKHDKRNIRSIAASLAKFGQRKPLIVQQEGMIVRAGNGTLEAARSLGWEEVAAVVIDDDNVTAAAYAIADNRTAELAEWDDDTLASVLGSLKDEGFDLDADLGFSDKEIDELLTPSGDREVEEDEVPEAPDDPITQPGDLIILGEHRLLCGDSTKREDVKLVLNGASCDTFTDPPYGIGYEYDDHDDSSSADNEKLVRAALGNAPGSQVYTPGLMNLGREMAHHKACRILVWHKGFAQSGNGLGGAGTWEPVVCAGVKGGRLPNDYLNFSTDREPGLRDKHSCPKPVKLFAHLIEHLSGAGVFDPFLGSGTTLIAAEQLGRRCCGIEISPAYCDVIVERWEKLTGKKAQRPPQQGGDE